MFQTDIKQLDWGELDKAIVQVHVSQDQDTQVVSLYDIATGVHYVVSVTQTEGKNNESGN